MHYKKITAQIVGAGAIIVLSAGSAYANLLENGSFEDAAFSGAEQNMAGGTTTAWSTYASGTEFRIQDETGGGGEPISGVGGPTAHDGSVAFKTWGGGVFQDEAVTAGTTYTISAYVLNPNNGDNWDGGGVADVLVDWRDGAGTLGATVVNSLDNTTAKDTWTLVSFDSEAPVGATIARVQVQHFGGGAARFDSVSLVAVPVPAAVWLFGSGLLGLIGVARRRKA